MVEKVVTSPLNVVDFARYQTGRSAAVRAPGISARVCRHCGAALQEDEREDECSSAFNATEVSLRWQAARILRGLI